MQLGNHLLLVIKANQKDISLDFYQKLGFNIVKKNVDNIILSNGKTLFLLHFGKINSHTKIVYYCPKIALTAAQLRFKKIDISLSNEKQTNTSQVVFQVCEKFNILLSDDVQYDVPLESLSASKENNVIGNFVEYSIHTKDIETDILSWQNLGFKRVLYSDCLSTSAILKHEQLQIGLYRSYKTEQKHSFAFRAEDTKESIDKVEKNGLKWAEKILPNQTGSFNAAKLITPENEYFWLFKSSVYGMKLVNMPPPSKAYF